MTSDWTASTKLAWSNINSDAMRPAKTKEAGEIIPNLPHVDGRYAKLGDHIDEFRRGLRGLREFPAAQSRDAEQGGLFDGFAGLPVRKVVRPTRFYYMLLQRLRDHRTMDDGVVWSAQADFLARLADWEKASDPLWPLQRAERAALLELNVPHFVLPSDGNEIRDASGISVRTEATPGLDRARARVGSLDEAGYRLADRGHPANTAAVSRSEGRRRPLRKEAAFCAPARRSAGKETFIAEADKIAAELARHAIRRGPGAAWIGLDWLGDSEVCPARASRSRSLQRRLRHRAFSRCPRRGDGGKSSRELALAAVAHLRKNLKPQRGAHGAIPGIGGATGLARSSMRWP